MFRQHLTSPDVCVADKAQILCLGTTNDDSIIYGLKHSNIIRTLMQALPVVMVKTF